MVCNIVIMEYGYLFTICFKHRKPIIYGIQNALFLSISEVCNWYTTTVCIPSPKPLSLVNPDPSTLTLCGSRKYPYPPHGWSLEIPRGWRVLKTKICKGKYEAKLEFPKGWGGGVQSKNHPWGRYGYFLEPHIIC